MLRFRFALLFALNALAQPAAPDLWEPLRALIGVWKGVAEGEPGRGTATREYRFVLNGKYIEVRNKSIYPPSARNPKGEAHEDWGMISFDRTRKRFVLRQFHGEGFVNQYVAEPPMDDGVRFVSESIENIPAGYRARETYSFSSRYALVEAFELAEPGKEFTIYSRTQFRREP